MQVSNLVKQSLPTILESGFAEPTLDLACGAGRNGLYLVAQGQSVTFADRQQEALDDVSKYLHANRLARYWCVDFEDANSDPLKGLSFSVILVFRYLHRPLMPAIKRAVHPGGLVIYETYTVNQPRFGRPTNPHFLLQPGELESMFDGWEILHHFEGQSISESNGQQQAIAQIVARRPNEAIPARINLI
ncbi:MAG: methyltransferase domain-containing protein [Halioglobus sp.]|nr:methyltransferase domain-containing protein [Halioglobus sp.]